MIFLFSSLPFFFRDLERIYFKQEATDIFLATLGYFMLSIRGAIFVQWIKNNLKQLAQNEFNVEAQLVNHEFQATNNIVI